MTARQLEPLGLLSGPDARIAIAANLARPLWNGPLAFTMVRQPGTSPVPVQDWPGSLEALTAALPRWAGLPPGPLVMGIVNVTPDSIFGRTLEPEAAVSAGKRLIAEGADLLDIGGESTRPGAEPVSPAEEQRRILPVIAALAEEGTPISVDTRNAETMARALEAGATIVNDISALRHDPDSAALVAERGCPVILMHMRGDDPRTMLDHARYTDVAAEVTAELAHRIAQAEAAGVKREQIAVDPGFGFAKRQAHSRELLQRLSLLLNLRCPIIAGLSGKGFVRAMGGAATAEESGPASVAAGLAALSRGATILRVHHVASTVQAIRVWRALNEEC